MARPCHIAHFVFQLDYGGLENGLVNLVNGLPLERYRHTIISLTDATGFRDRIASPQVDVIELHKRPGADRGILRRVHALLGRLRPDVVHTRNFSTLEIAAVACAVRVPTRIHGEHGWDVHDPDGHRLKYRLARRVTSAVVSRFVAVSTELQRWLIDRCGVPSRKVHRICNGVDTNRFHPNSRELCSPVLGGERHGVRPVVVGSVTRFKDIKDPLNLVAAFAQARAALLPRGIDLRLAMVGDGPLRDAALARLAKDGVADAAWLPGSRDDIAALLRSIDVFVLGSLREGISNTVLEAMSSGLPVIATATGGNLELVDPGVTGLLVPPADSAALAAAIEQLALDETSSRRFGTAGRDRAVARYSLHAMLQAYDRLYCGAAPYLEVAS